MDKADDILEIKAEKDIDEQSLIEYDITTYPSDFTLSVLHEMWKNRSINIPDYQRDFVWTINQSSLLIESFLIGLPVPPVFFYIDDENKNLVIDGQQRLLSIFYFFEGYFGKENEKGKRQVFRLTGLNEKNPFFNKTFEGLDEKIRRKFEGAVLRAINIRQLKPKDGSSSVYYIFERLNTGGTPLKPQEIRNCVYRGSFLKRLRTLNENLNWRKILGKTMPDKHQTDVELILRAFGLCYDFSEYEKPMKQFLNNTAKKYQNDESKIVEFEQRFNKATEIISEKLREKPFAVRGPLNTSVFDSIFCTLINNVDNLPNDISLRYESLIKNEKFVEFTTLATSDAKILKDRFMFVKNNLIG
jgi:uncharacterized protein with ParB-like and HNH nuclease domain